MTFATAAAAAEGGGLTLRRRIVTHATAATAAGAGTSSLAGGGEDSSVQSSSLGSEGMGTLRRKVRQVPPGEGGAIHGRGTILSSEHPTHQSSSAKSMLCSPSVAD